VLSRELYSVTYPEVGFATGLIHELRFTVLRSFYNLLGSHPAILLLNTACIFKMRKIDGLIDYSKSRPFHSFLCGKGSVLSPKWVQITPQKRTSKIPKMTPKLCPIYTRISNIYRFIQFLNQSTHQFSSFSVIYPTVVVFVDSDIL